MRPSSTKHSFALFERSLWSDVAHALSGEQRDYLAEPLSRAVLMLALPMMMEMLMEALFALVATFWVGRLGPGAVAVVGLIEAVMTLIYAIAVGISFAATAIVARRIGASNPQLASQAAGQILLFGGAVSTALGLALGPVAAEILEAMSSDAAIVDLGTGFARIMFGCNATVFVIFVINAIFRGAGDAVLAMRTLWLANALNVILCPCFIFGWGPFPETGVTGAAIATNLARGIGVAYQLWHLCGRNSRVRIHLRDLRPAPALLRRIAVTAGTGVAQMLITTISWVALFRIVAIFGTAAVAGYTVAMRLVNVAMLAGLGLANAGATLVGQNLGAQRPDRAEDAVRIAMRWNVVLFSIVGAVFVVLAEPLVQLFTSDVRVITHGADALRIVSLGFPLYAAGNCLSAAFNGAGDTWTPTRLNFCCFWLGQLPLAWILAHTLGFGPVGVFVAVLVSFSILALWNRALFNRGQWKLHRL